MKQLIATYWDEKEYKLLVKVANRRKWSLAQTVNEFAKESFYFRSIRKIDDAKNRLAGK